MYQLRDYQSAACSSVWSYLLSTLGNPVVELPTGAGKSLCIADLCREAVQKWGGRVLVLAHRKELLSQNAEKIVSLLPEIPVGIYSAGLNMRHTDKAVVCCGIQSVHKKASEFGARHLVIIDEVHLTSPAGEGMYRTFLDDLRKFNPKMRMVGLTATPYRTGEGALCRPNGLFQQICYTAPIPKLIEQGYLSQIISNVGDASADTSKLHIRAGEFINSELEQLFDVPAVVKAACAEIVAKSAGRQSVLVFCSGVTHAKHVAQELSTLTGEKCGTVTGDTLPIERANILSDFRNRRLRWLTNVDVLCLDQETEILTQEGWVGIDEMTAEHNVASWDDDKIYFAPPKTIVRRPRMEGEEIVSLKTNGIDIRVTGNHRMIVRCGENGLKYKKVPALELVGKRRSLPSQGIATPTVFADAPDDSLPLGRRISANAYNYRRAYGMSMEESKAAAAVAIAERTAMRHKLPHELSNLECQFIGFWIGDGTLSCGRCSLSQSAAYPDTIAWVDATLESLGLTHSRKVYLADKKSKNQSVRWTLARGTGFGSQKTTGGYFGIEKYLVKDGSSLLWGLSREQFSAFLHGLWMADGLHHAKRPLLRIACTNRKLLDFIQAIGTCRGFRMLVRRLGAPRKVSHSQQWSISWSSRRGIVVGKQRFAVEKDWKKERVWCVTSATGNIVTRRNGAVAVVGNTTGFDAPCIDCIAILRATCSPGLFSQICGRGFRLFPSKENCLVLDFGENILRHGPLDAIDFGKPKKKNPDADAPTKKCPNCESDVPLSATFCPACNFQFPPRQLKHGEEADRLAQILSKPQDWLVEEVNMSRHRKAKGIGPDTLRVDYICRIAGHEGNLVLERISEWVCLDHDGWAGQKAQAWWRKRSDAAPVSDDTGSWIDSCIDWWNRGAVATPTKITTIREGKWYRITDYVLDPIPPEEDWQAQAVRGDVFETEELPF